MTVVLPEPYGGNTQIVDWLPVDGRCFVLGVSESQGRPDFACSQSLAVLIGAAQSIDT